MSTSDNVTRQNLSEEEIDEIIVAQANDDSAWEEPIQVHQKQPTSVSIPSELAARAAFLAKLHREPAVEDWIARIIRERIELEEAAFFEMKRDLLNLPIAKARGFPLPDPDGRDILFQALALLLQHPDS